MSFVCATLEVLEGVQQCVLWVEHQSIYEQLSINGAQARAIYLQFSKVCAGLIVFTIVAKATKLL